MTSAIQFEMLRNSEVFQELRSVILSQVASLPEARVREMSDDQIAASISDEQRDFRENQSLMLRIEGLVVKLLGEIVHEDYCSLQFPVNIRSLASGVSYRESFNKRGYATDLIHCDGWSGAPSDSWNHLLYLLYIPEAPYLEIFETLAPDSPLREYIGDYKSVHIDTAELKKVSVTPESGLLVIWPTYSPHRTVVPVKPSRHRAWRVSIDFRTRSATPYVEDRNCPKGTFSSTKMNSAGVYWTFPRQEFLNLESKTSAELRAATLHGTDALADRQDYLRRYYQAGVHAG